MTNVNDSLASFTEQLTSSVTSGFYRSGPFAGVTPNARFRHWLLKLAINGLPDDTFKKGYQWIAEPEQITAIDAIEKRHRIKKKKRDALAYANEDGEAYLYIDTGAKADTEINPEREKLRFVNAFRRYQLTMGPIITDPLSEYYWQPEYYMINAVKIHPSRICRVCINPDEMGWGLGVIPFVIQPISDLIVTEGNTVSLTTEALIDVLSVNGLMECVSDDEDVAKMVKRYELLRQGKATNKMIVLDKEKEAYDRKPTTVTGMTDIVTTMRRAVAGAMDRPYSLIWDREGGLGSNGETDLKNYYDAVSDFQRNTANPAFYMLDEMVVRTATGQGTGDIYLDWFPLFEMSEKEKSEIADKLSSTAERLVKSGVFNPEVLSLPTMNSLVELGVFQGLEQSFNDFYDPESGMISEDDINAEPDLDNA